MKNPMNRFVAVVIISALLVVFGSDIKQLCDKAKGVENTYASK